jgi:hypothetical protein
MLPERPLEHGREDPREHERRRHRQAEQDEEGGSTLADPAGHDLLVQDDDDGAVRQVQAVGREAEVAQRPRVEQPQQRSRMPHGQTGQQACDGRAEREVDPEQVVERPE